MNNPIICIHEQVIRQTGTRRIRSIWGN